MSRQQRAQKARLSLASMAVSGHATNGHALTGECVDQTRLLAALRGLRAGSFDVRLPLDWVGVPGNISEVFNDVVELSQRLNRELERVSRTAGGESKSEQRLALAGASGEWATTIDSINLLIADLTQSNVSKAELAQSHAQCESAADRSD